MVLKVVAVITLSMLTACRDKQTLSIVHAASAPLKAASQKQTSYFIHGPTHKPGIDMQQITNTLYKNAPPQYCYSYTRRRPKDQRANAVQARLEQADRMVAAFEPDFMTVDLIGDHANILSLEFPAAWPDQSRVDQISSVVEEYFASADIEDYLCGAGFAEVQLSARSVADGRLHSIWSAQVTSEGLLKFTALQALAR
jgi:hypothetical protein